MKYKRMIASAIVAALLLPQICSIRVPAETAGREREFTPYYNGWIALDDEQIAAQAPMENGPASLETGRPVR